MTILAIVSAEKEGQIESKMIKARQMEEIREAKRKEAEARAEKRKSKLVRPIPSNREKKVNLADLNIGEYQGRIAKQEEEETKQRSYGG